MDRSYRRTEGTARSDHGIRIKTRNKTYLLAFQSYLKKNKLNLTIERRAMLPVVALMKGWFSVGDFFKAARRRNAVHSKSTVHRSMPLFVGAGLVEEKRSPNGRRGYKTVR